MPSVHEIAQEMQAAGQALGAPMDFDGVRRAKMQAVESLTGRPLIVYAVDLENFAKTAGSPLHQLINFQDKDGFIEAFRGLQGTRVDVLLQSPGGLAEATESLVHLLRNRFPDGVRFIVPSFAKSAATMLAMSGDELVLGVASELGPIDPQAPTSSGRPAPAQAIMDQFEQAKDELQRSPAAIPAWMPILQEYGPSLLQECGHHIRLSEELVSDWLERYMFAGESDAQEHADRVARELNNSRRWRTHSRRIGIDLLKDEFGLKIHDLRDDPALEEAVWTLHSAINITFRGTGAFKLVENAYGGALIGMAQQVTIQAVPADPNAPTQPDQQIPPSNPSPPNQQHKPNRAERRRAEREQRL